MIGAAAGRRQPVRASGLASPEALCWRSDGFVNQMAAIHGDEDLWRWERPRQDLVLFRMTRSL